jgi:hypothetical protein
MPHLRFDDDGEVVPVLERLEGEPIQPVSSTSEDTADEA